MIFVPPTGQSTPLYFTSQYGFEPASRPGAVCVCVCVEVKKNLFMILLLREAPAVPNFDTYLPYCGVGGVHGHNYLGRG